MVDGPRGRHAVGATVKSWKPLKIGAGGWVTQLDLVDNAGTTVMVIGTDVGGGYVWNGAQWDPLCTQTSLPAGDAGVDVSGGVYALAISPSTPTTFYMSYNGYVFKSTNSGALWARTDFPNKTMSPNDSYRTHGEKLAVDPNTAEHVLAGVGNGGSGGGLWRSTDGGTNFTQVTGLATPSAAGVTGIVFDHNSSVVSTRTQIVYASVRGTGTYRSTDGGATFSIITGGPTDVKHAKVGEDGTYYATGVAAESVARWKTGDGWTNIFPTAQSDRSWHVVLPDLVDANRVVLIGDGGLLVQSDDQGATWSTINFATKTRVATDVPWLAVTEEDYMSAGNALWDPNVTDQIWFAEGIGVWYLSYGLTPDDPQVYTSQSAGIEELVANDVLSPTSGAAVLAFWDRPLFYSDNHDTYATAHGVNYDSSIIMAWAIDIDPQDPDRLVAIVNFAVDDSAHSADGGKTWTEFADKTPWGTDAWGGSMAVNGDNVIWIPSGSATHSRYYSTDNGANWNTFSLPGVTRYDDLHRSYFLKRKIVVGDLADADTFYLFFNNSEEPTGGNSGVFKSTDGGANWTRIYTGNLGGATTSAWNGKLKKVPGQTGHLMWTGGDVGGSIAGGLYRSTDSGVTWAAFPDVLEAKDFGFSASAPGESYPAMAFAGWYDNEWGFWRTDDASVSSPTWVKFGDFPLGIVDTVVCMDGDIGIYDQWYVGYSGTSFVYYG